MVFGSKQAGSTRFRSKRDGVSIFVNNVSKRIHPAALKESFQSYGKVVDVFIAYNHIKRRCSPTTFAFVRFNRFEDARVAIAKANGRRMDGFYSSTSKFLLRIGQCTHQAWINEM
ncbi:hypothetical protein V6N11_052574 [Hibiscus sabdariffa]|uniref:RRM domain-containing protein n=1 Tax=Hibiscus sabdariffa TaxID=183260 RepID=A0ABR2UAE9_9ROSI